MQVLVKTKHLTKEEWLKYRTQGIGGSDVSVIAGVNPFKSICQLWREKTGQIEPEQTENEYAHFGTMLEPIVKKEFMERTGLKVRTRKALLQSSEYPFMIADLDGSTNENGEMCIFEAKTASAYKQSVWEEGVPVEYVLQVQHYMAVTGARKAYVAVLVGGNHFYYHKIARDEELIQKIIVMEKYFWEQYVVAGKEPIPDGSSATTDYLDSRYCETNGESIALPEEALGICQQYNDLSKKLEEVKTQREAVSNQLKSYLKECESGTVGDWKVTWKQVNRTSFDQKRLKEEQPKIYETYVTQSKYRKLSVA